MKASGTGANDVQRRRRGGYRALMVGAGLAATGGACGLAWLVRVGADQESLRVVARLLQLGFIILMAMAFATVWASYQTHRLRWAAILGAGAGATAIFESLALTFRLDGESAAGWTAFELTALTSLSAGLLISIMTVQSNLDRRFRARGRERNGWLLGFVAVAAVLFASLHAAVLADPVRPQIAVVIANLAMLGACALLGRRIDYHNRPGVTGHYPALLGLFALGGLFHAGVGVATGFPLLGEAYQCGGALLMYRMLREYCLRRPFRDLASAERRLRQVMGASPDGMLIVGGDGRIVGLSVRAANLFGYAKAELVGQPVETLIPTSRRAGHAERRATYASRPAVRDMGVSQDLQGLHKDGSLIPVDISLSPLRIDDDDRVIAVVRDLRERKLVDRELRQKERQLRTIMESTPDAILRFDRRFTVRYANSATLASPLWREMVQPVAIEAPPPVRQLRQHLARAMAMGEPGVWEVRDDADDKTYLVRLVPESGDDGALESILAVIADVTAVARIETESRRSLAIIDAIPDAVCISDPEGGLTYVNPAARALFQIGEDCDIGKRRIDDFFPAELRGHVRQTAMARARQSGRWREELFVAIPRNPELPVEFTLLAHRDKSGAVRYLTHMFHDLSERKEFEARLLFQATHDSLTSLPNRTILIDQISRARHRALRHARLAAVLFVDLDDFKTINDTLGHHVGDQLLIQVACRLTDSLRACDTVVRVGGDEFAVIIEDIGRKPELMDKLDSLAHTLWQPYDLSGRTIAVTGSIGVSVIPEDSAEPEDILRHADMAMYAAKRREKGTWEEYRPHMDADLRDLVEFTAALRSAVAGNELRLHYQPKRHLRSGLVTGLEVLLRWQHPVRGLLGPDQFISLAEQTGLILSIGEWVLRTACQDARQRHLAGLPRHRIAVNISPRQFRDLGLARMVSDIFEETGLEPEYLELEITESLVMEHPDNALQTMRDLRALGVTLTIDDFGTGHSSLAALRRFPVDFIKVDRAFIREVTSDQNDAAITSAIISMARILGLKVVAEGVETPEQVEFLLDQGCDEYQGYLFSKPVPSDQVDDCLMQWSSGVANACSGKPASPDVSLIEAIRWERKAVARERVQATHAGADHDLASARQRVSIS